MPCSSNHLDKPASRTTIASASVSGVVVLKVQPAVAHGTDHEAETLLVSCLDIGPPSDLLAIAGSIDSPTSDSLGFDSSPPGSPL